jgi:uncharacterized protein
MNSFLDDPYVAASPECRPFWEAAEQGQFFGKQCGDCVKFHWYPRILCPFCGSARTEWAPLSGRGTVYAYSTLRRADTPYTVAYVQLAEGPMLLTNLVGITSSDMSIGMPVEVVFQRTEEGRTAPKFTSPRSDPT